MPPFALDDFAEWPVAPLALVQRLRWAPSAATVLAMLDAAAVPRPEGCLVALAVGPAAVWHEDLLRDVPLVRRYAPLATALARPDVSTPCREQLAVAMLGHLDAPPAGAGIGTLLSALLTVLEARAFPHGPAVRTWLAHHADRVAARWRGRLPHDTVADVLVALTGHDPEATTADLTRALAAATTLGGRSAEAVVTHPAADASVWSAVDPLLLTSWTLRALLGRPAAWAVPALRPLLAGHLRPDEVPELLALTPPGDRPAVVADLDEAAPAVMAAWLVSPAAAPLLPTLPPPTLTHAIHVGMADPDPGRVARVASALATLGTARAGTPPARPRGARRGHG